MKFVTLITFFVFTYFTTLSQSTVLNANKLVGTTWKDYMCTVNNKNYKFNSNDILTFYSFKRDSSVTTWTIDKTRKDYVANGKYKIANGILIMYNMKYEKSSYGEWAKEWTMKIEEVDDNTLRLWTPCRSELPAWLYIKKVQ